MHEAQLHEHNVFVTLTYNDENIPPGMSLRHRDWQLFAKKLRKKKGPFKFYMCGEYGETFSRPHMHACIFGIDFEDKYPWRKNASDHQLYRSETLEKLWTYGDSEFGAVTFESAAYVARYVMKKITGDLAEQHYTYIDHWGEIHQRVPEYNQMSRGGRNGKGLAHGWITRFHRDVYPSDQVITRGHPSQPPRYYDLCAEQGNLASMDEIRKQRIAKLDRKDNTPKRLKTKEIVKQAQLTQLKRTIQ